MYCSAEVSRTDSRRSKENLTTIKATPSGTSPQVDGGGSTASVNASPGVGIPNVAAQLTQYKQRLQLMNQQLRAGQQQLKDLQKNPSQAQKVCFRKHGHACVKPGPEG